jgi:hypothetical protein
MGSFETVMAGRISKRGTLKPHRQAKLAIAALLSFDMTIVLDIVIFHDELLDFHQRLHIETLEPLDHSVE